MRLAVICAVYNEEVLLPQFLDYYAPQVDTVFLLDNESTDRTREIARRYPNVIVSSYSSGGQFSDVALSEAYNRKRLECAGLYDYVVIADCDEFVAPKNCASLREEICAAQPPIMTGLGVEFFWTQGWNMWASPDAPKYTAEQPLLPQRQTGIFSLMYSKPCIIRPGSRLRYEHGRHDFAGFREAKPQDMQPARFHLLHYVGFDLEEFVRRGLERSTRFAQVNILMGTSGQYLRKSAEDFRSYFAERQASGLTRVPFEVPRNEGVPHVRHLMVGSRTRPMWGWDTVDWEGEAAPTFRFELLSPDWPIPSDSYDEAVVADGLPQLAPMEVAVVLRRLWKVLKVGAPIRILLEDARPFDVTRAALFKAGFMDIEDVSRVYADVHRPSGAVISAVKQAVGGTFGWLPR